MKMCDKCTYYSNGWCHFRKTNKLKELTDCEHKKTDSLIKLEAFYEQKKFELKLDPGEYNEGIVKGLEIALMIMK